MSLIHWLLEPGTTRLAVAILWAFVALVVGCCVVSNRKSGRTVRHG